MKTTLPCLLFFILLGSFNARAQWQLKPSGTFASLYDIYFPNADTGYVAGNNGALLRSVDQGENWSILPSPTLSSINALHFFSGTEGWLASDSGLFQTADAGNTWNRVTTLPLGSWSDIAFTDAQVGFLAGADGVIARSPDFGLTWTLDSTPLTRQLVSLSFPSDLVGYATATGYNWQFLKTTDGGLSWNLDTIQPINNVGSLESVYFTSETRGFIAGWYISTFVGTQDGGDNWSDLAAAAPVDLYSLDFPDSQHGYACGWNMTICRTLDGGDNWSFETIPGFAATLYAIRFLDAQTGFVVGDGGLIFKTTNGGTTSLPGVTSKSAGFYPNPVESGGVLQCLPGWSLEQTSVELLDLRGAVVMSRSILGAEEQLPLPALPSGVYTIRVVREGKPVVNQLLMVR